MTCNRQSIPIGFDPPSSQGRGGGGEGVKFLRMSSPLLLLSTLLLLSSPAHAKQNLGGDTGLIKIPTAEVIDDGDLAFNFSWVGGSKSYLQRPRINRLYTATVGVFPNLEVCFRITQVIGWKDPQVYIENAADRMVSAKYRIPLWKEGAIALGVNDLLSINSFNLPNLPQGATQYGQTTLYMALSQGFGPIHLHGGYAQSKSAINGLFAGIEACPIPWVRLLAEYDSHDYNVGVQTGLFDVLNLGAYWLGGQDYACSAALRLHL